MTKDTDMADRRLVAETVAALGAGAAMGFLIPARGPIRQEAQACVRADRDLS